MSDILQKFPPLAHQPVILSGGVHLRLAAEILAGLPDATGIDVGHIASCLDTAVRFNEGVEKARDGYRRAVELLIASEVAKPILATDWSVDRVGAANASLGFVSRGLSLLQDVLSRAYDPSSNHHHLHLHKGPGNGKYPHLLRQEQNSKSKKHTEADYTPFVEVGIGDSLYFTIDDMLMQCLRSKKLEKNQHVQKAIHILSNMIQRLLRKRWYDAEKSDYAVGEWKKIGETRFDMNEIYKIFHGLQSGGSQQDVAEIISLTTGEVAVSEIFELDGVELLDIETWLILLLMLGKKFSDIAVIFATELVPHFQRKLAGLESQVKNGHYTQTTRIDTKIQSLQKEEIQKQYDRVRQKIEDINRVMRILMSGGSDFDGLKDLFDTPLTKVTYIDIFSGAFLDGYKHHTSTSKRQVQESSNGIDMNHLPVVYLQDFVRGYFTNIGKIFKDYSFMLISAIRSDSHENDKHFFRDLERCIPRLASGGVLVSDGIYESFTGIGRLDIVQKVVQKSPGILQVEVIYDPENKRCKSVMLQRSSKCGYMTDEQKAEFIDPRNKRITLEEAVHMAGVYVENQIRKFIIIKGLQEAEGQNTDGLDFEEARQQYDALHQDTKHDVMSTQMLRKAKGVKKLKGKHRLITKITHLVLDEAGVQYEDSVEDDTLKQVLDLYLQGIRDYL